MQSHRPSTPATMDIPRRVTTIWDEASREPTGVPQQDGTTGPRVTQHGQAMLSRSERLLAMEPNARRILTHLGMELRAHPRFKDRVCDVHRKEADNGVFFEQSIVKDRALMPMCKPCVRRRLDEIFAHIPGGLPPDYTWPDVDTCICAATICCTGKCSWCIIETITAIRDEYLVEHSVPTIRIDDDGNLHSHGSDLRCKCGDKPMVFKEEFRNCAACDGLVRLPLHAIDQTTHLAAGVWQPSKYVGDFSESPSHNILTNSYRTCKDHPVRITGSWLPQPTSQSAGSSAPSNPKPQQPNGPSHPQTATSSSAFHPPSNPPHTEQERQQAMQRQQQAHQLMQKELQQTLPSPILQSLNQIIPRPSPSQPTASFPQQQQQQQPQPNLPAYDGMPPPPLPPHLLQRRQTAMLPPTTTQQQQYAIPQPQPQQPNFYPASFPTNFDYNSMSASGNETGTVPATQPGNSSSFEPGHGNGYGYGHQAAYGYGFGYGYGYGHGNFDFTQTFANANAAASSNANADADADAYPNANANANANATAPASTGEDWFGVFEENY